MNFYGCEVPARIEIDTPSKESAVFEILNLSAALFIQNSEMTQIHGLEMLDDKKRVLIDAVEKLLVQVRSIGFRLLELLRRSAASLVCTHFLCAYGHMIEKTTGFSKIGINSLIKHF